MMRLYYALYFILHWFFLPFELGKRRPENRRQWLSEKRGYLPQVKGDTVVWIHAVSVGEAIAVSGLVKRLKEQRPDIAFVISTITDTGRAVARKTLGDSATVVYMPFDLGYVIRRAIKAIKPSLFILVETEIWPGAIHEMNMAGVPVAMVNGRVSEKSARGYTALGGFLRAALNKISLFCMQDESYADRIISLGAPSERVRITGNFKFDITGAHEKPDWASGVKGPVIVAGSTHKGEEELLLDCYAVLSRARPSLTLVLAPRHPERLAEVRRMLAQKGVSYINRSSMKPGEAPPPGIILLDTMGELFRAYGMADIAVIGKSFYSEGGQNPLEPAYWGKAIVCGPHMENFPFMSECLKMGGAIETSADGLLNALEGLLSDDAKRAETGRRAREFYDRHSGAIDKTVKEIRENIGII